MLLTPPLLAKSSFFGSLINKCRQVIKISSTKPTTSNNSSSSLINNYETVTVTMHDINSTDYDNNRPVAAANLSLSTATGAKTIEERVGLPPRPKKPLTPYFRFMQELRPKLSSENPKASITDVVREISKRWNTVEPSLKDRLQAEYQQDKQVYIELRTKYDAKLTEGQRAEIKQLKQDIVESKERRMLRKRVKELGRPKKPASAYLLFIAKERIDSPQTAKQTYREWHQKSTAKWARLSDEEKSAYMQAARKELDKYKKDISAWEEKMIKQGNIDVVRNSNLIDPPEPKPRKQ